MALDEALMVLGGATPVLRIYGWTPACLSIGYSQNATRDIDAPACASRGIDLVRRPTGGSAVLHDAEVTYSLNAPDEHFAVSGTILESYRKVSGALVAAMAHFGLGCELASIGARPAAGIPACFAAASALEVSLAGRKLVGSAQLRRPGRILQHGSILLDLDRDRSMKLFRSGHQRQTILTPQPSLDRATSLREALGRAVSMDEAAEALVAGFRECFGVKFVKSEVTPEETRLAAELRTTKYGNPEWTMRR